MAKVNAKFDDSGLVRVLTGPDGVQTRLAMRAARAIERSARMKAPVGVSGNLRNSVYRDPVPKIRGGRMTIEVGASAHYAIYVHEGVKGGKIIRPVNAKALKFQIGGRTVFAKSVVQGSQKARPFLANAAREEGAKLGFRTSGVP